MSEINEIARQQVSFANVVAPPSLALDSVRSVFYPAGDGVWYLYDNPAWWGPIRPMGLELWFDNSSLTTGHVEFRLCPTPERNSGVFFRLDVEDGDPVPANLVESSMRRLQYVSGQLTQVDPAVYDPAWTGAQQPYGYSYGTGQLAFNWTTRSSHGTLKPGLRKNDISTYDPIETEPYDVLSTPRIFGKRAVLTYGNIAGAEQTRNISLLPGGFRFRFGVYQQDGPDADPTLSYLGSVAADHHLELFEPPSVSFQNPQTLLANSYGLLLAEGDLLNDVVQIYRWTVRYSRSHGGRRPGENVLLWPGKTVAYRTLPALQRSQPNDARSPNQTASVWHLPLLGVPDASERLTDRESHHHLSAGIPADSGQSSHTPDSNTESSSLVVTIETSAVDWWSQRGRFAVYDQNSGAGEHVNHSHMSTEVRHEPDDPEVPDPPDPVLPTPDPLQITHYVFLDYPIRETLKTYELPRPPASSEDLAPPLVVLTSIGQGDFSGTINARQTFSPRVRLPGGDVITLDSNLGGAERSLVWDREADEYKPLLSLVSNRGAVGMPVLHHISNKAHALTKLDEHDVQLSPGGFWKSFDADYFSDAAPLRFGQGNNNYTTDVAAPSYQTQPGFVVEEHYANWARVNSVAWRNGLILPADFEVLDVAPDVSLEDLATQIKTEANLWYSGSKTTETFALTSPYIHDWNWSSTSYTEVQNGKNLAGGELLYQTLPTGDVEAYAWRNDPEPSERAWVVSLAGADVLAGPYTHNSWVEEFKTESAQLMFQILPNSFRSSQETSRVDTSRSALPLSFHSTQESPWKSTTADLSHDEFLSGQLDLEQAGGQVQEGLYVTTPERIAVRGLIRVTAVCKAKEFKKKGLGIAIGEKAETVYQYIYDDFGEYAPAGWGGLKARREEWERTKRSLVVWPVTPGDAENYVPTAIADAYDTVTVVSWDEADQSQVEGQEGEVKKYTQTIPLSCLLSTEKSEQLRNGEEITIPLRSLVPGLNTAHQTPNEDYCVAGVDVGNFLGLLDWSGQTLPPTPLVHQFSSSSIKLQLV